MRVERPAMLFAESKNSGRRKALAARAPPGDVPTRFTSTADFFFQKEDRQSALQDRVPGTCLIDGTWFIRVEGL